MYFLRRLIFAVPLLLVISALAFSLMRLAPGGPFDRERVPASPEIERNLRAKYHLDEPLWRQYGRYLGDLAHGDFGVSLKYRDHTVNDIIAQGLPVSMLLGSLAFGFAMGVGLPLGFLTAARRGRWEDFVGSFFSQLRHLTAFDPCLCHQVAIAPGWPVGNPVAHGSAADRARPFFCGQSRPPFP